MSFGSFENLCAQSSLPICSLLGPPSSITFNHAPLLPTICTARSIELANTIIFQAATDFAHIGALAMTAIMVFHVRSKFTAVGRREILTFFYLYMGLTVVSLILDAGVLQAGNTGAFPWFVAAQNGLASALCTSLLVNGFVGFQLYEDGTILSVWLLRLSSLGMFFISFAVSLLTVKGWAGLSPTNTTGLFVVLYVINALCIAVYLVMQVILVVNTLQDRWPLGDLAFGVFFLIIGQVILYVFGETICNGINHYLDGLFFATICNLLAVMMIYKYWDSITKEDLEFSVGTKQGEWQVKEALMDPSMDNFGHYEDRPGSLYDASSSFDYLPSGHHPQHQHQQRGYSRSASRLSNLDTRSASRLSNFDNRSTSRLSNLDTRSASRLSNVDVRKSTVVTGYHDDPSVDSFGYQPTRHRSREGDMTGAAGVYDHSNRFSHYRD